MQLTQSPNFEGVIPVVNIHTGEGMDGYLTDQATDRVFEIDDGEVYIARDQEITKSRLRDGLEALMQAPGYVALHDVIELRSNKMDTLLAVPELTENFDFSEYVGNLHEQKKVINNQTTKTGNFVIWSYPKFSTIDLYVADSSVYDSRDEEGLKRFDTDNQKLWPSQGFVDDVIELRDLTTPLLEKYFGIDFETYIQSKDTDVDFPIGYPESSKFAGSYKNAPFDITQITSQENGIIEHTRMFQLV